MSIKTAETSTRRKRAAKATAPRQDNRREPLLDAAAALFSARGYHAVTMREIAGSAGMMAGSVYYHFPSKEELLAAVYEEGVSCLTNQVAAAYADISDPWARLRAACRAHAELLLDQSDYAQVMLRVLPEDVPAIRARLIAARDAYETIIRDLVDALPLPPGSDRQALRLMLLGALNWAKTWYRPGAKKPAEIVDGMINILESPLRAEETTP